MLTKWHYNIFNYAGFKFDFEFNICCSLQSWRDNLNPINQSFNVTVIVAWPFLRLQMKEMIT